jgi:hypothetical protein
MDKSIYKKNLPDDILMNGREFLAKEVGEYSRIFPFYKG